MAIVDTYELNEFVGSQGGANDYWIGLHDTHGEGMFQWVDGSNITFGSTFEEYPWNSGEPNNAVRYIIYTLYAIYINIYQ